MGAVKAHGNSAAVAAIVCFGREWAARKNAPPSTDDPNAKVTPALVAQRLVSPRVLPHRWQIQGVDLLAEKDIEGIKAVAIADAELTDQQVMDDDVVIASFIASNVDDLPIVLVYTVVLEPVHGGRFLRHPPGTGRVSVEQVYLFFNG